ncbi:MAG: hypothetical protein V4463_15885 [Pseudomonadota bacterium]
MKTLIAIIASAAAAASLAGSACAASAEQKAGLKAATTAAEADFLVARRKCEVLSGNPGAVCVAEARLVQTHAETEAKLRFDDSLGTRTAARKAVAESEFDLAKMRCKSETGNDKDVCMKQANANKVIALADAKADSKVLTARDDAEHDKAKARYKVALEHCDAFKGKTHDDCVVDAKARFGQ